MLRENVYEMKILAGRETYGQYCRVVDKIEFIMVL